MRNKETTNYTHSTGEINLIVVVIIAKRDIITAVCVQSV